MNDGDGIAVTPTDFVQAQLSKLKWTQHNDGCSLCREDLRPWAMFFSQDNAQGFAMIDRQQVRSSSHMAYYGMTMICE